jgi:hypothetical protein
LENATNGLLLVGLIVVGAGVTLWIINMLFSHGVSLEAGFVLVGVVLIVFAVVVAKVFSKD